jgi:GntP family gluconate:H+ symporter
VPTVLTVLLPVALMLLRAFGEVFLDEESSTRSALDVVGTPVVALLAGLILGMFTLGVQAGFSRGRPSSRWSGCWACWRSTSSPDHSGASRAVPAVPGQASP